MTGIRTELTPPRAAPAAPKLSSVVSDLDVIGPKMREVEARLRGEVGRDGVVPQDHPIVGLLAEAKEPRQLEQQLSRWARAVGRTSSMAQALRHALARRDSPAVTPELRGAVPAQPRAEPRGLEPGAAGVNLRTAGAAGERALGVRAAGSWLATLREQSVSVGNAMLAQAKEHWNPADYFGERWSRDASLLALVRFNVAADGVYADLLEGRLTLGALGKSAWSAVTPEDLNRLTVQRLASGNVDWDAGAAAMLARPGMPPLVLSGPEGKVELSPKNAKTFNLSTLLRRDDGAPARALADSPAGQRLLQAAAQAARARDGASFEQHRRSELVRTLELLVRGRDPHAGVSLGEAELGLASASPPGGAAAWVADTSQLVPMLTAITGVTPTRLEAPLAATADNRRDLELRQRRGEVVAVLELHRDAAGKPLTEPRLVAVVPKTIEELATEIVALDAQGKLAPLDEAARRTLLDLLGQPPGAELARRIEQNAHHQAVRSFLAGAGQGVSFLIPVGLLGNAVRGGAIVLLEGTTLVRSTLAARAIARGSSLAAEGVAYTALQQVSSGQYSASGYARGVAENAIMLGWMRAVSPFLRPGGGALGAAARTAGGASAAAAGMTGMGYAFGEEWKGFGDLGQKLGNSLAMVAVMQGAGKALGGALPQLRPDAPERRRAEQLQARLDQKSREIFDLLAGAPEAQAKVDAAGAQVARLRNVDKLPDSDPRLKAALEHKAQADAEAVAFVRQKLGPHFEQLRALRADIGAFLDRHAPHLRADFLGGLDASAALADFSSLRPEQARAVLEVIVSSASPTSLRQLGVAPGVVAPGVEHLSPQALHGMIRLLADRFGSYDMAGAANVNHVLSVAREALPLVSRELGRPLSQREVDLIFLETAATDFRGKILDLKVLAEQVTANGKKVIENYEIMRANVEVEINAAAGAQLADAGLRDIVARLAKAQALPASASAVAEHPIVVEAKLGPAQRRQLESFWREHVLERDFVFVTNPILAGTWAHGVLDARPVIDAARVGGAKPHEVKRLVLSHYVHHLSHFPARLLGAGGFPKPDFVKIADELVREGVMPRREAKAFATTLSGWWDVAVPYYTKWAPKLDAALREGRGLRADEMAAAFKEAEGIRRQVEALPPEVRAQLLADNLGQFTHDGMPKWTGLAMLPPTPATMGELSKRLAATMITPYLTFDLLRDYPGAAEAHAAIAQGTHPHVQKIRSIETALGFEVVPGTPVSLRPLEPGTPKYREHALRIVSDAQLGRAFAESHKLDPSSPEAQPRELVSRFGAEAVVGWFQAQAAVPGHLNRLVASAPR